MCPKSQDGGRRTKAGAPAATGASTWKLLIEYDGTRYSGWQKQQHARTVQGELLKAAEDFLQTKVEIGGSGRTDSGVHALGQVAHLKVREGVRPPPAQQLRMGLNDRLPHDINVLNVEPAPHHFHARHDAVARFYLYQIATRRTAFGKPYVWWVKDRLNVALMQEACALLAGRHDFRSFTEQTPGQLSTIVLVETAYIFTSGSLILFRIGASHFLWKMVRRIVGALVMTGRGKLPVADFRQLLEGDSREAAAWTAPPAGLFLERVLCGGGGDRAPESREAAFPVG